MEGIIYLDNAATTRVAEEVVDKMLPYFTEYYGIPSSEFSHQMGQQAKEALEQSRRKIAAFIGAEPEEIVFTSGGTEANNLAISGYLAANPKKKHIITTRIEHYSVLHTIMRHELNGYKVTYIGVNRDGIIDLAALEQAITEDTALVSVQTANQETGVIQPISEIAKICEQYGVPLHTDAAIALGWSDFNVQKLGVSLAAFSAHKFYGPKGVGALFVKKGLKLKKLFEGGFSENNMRPGVLNIPGIIGFAAALELWNADELKQVSELRDYLEERISQQIKHIQFNGHRQKRLPHISNITFKYVEGESIVLHLDLMGIQVVTGSACFSRALEPSHVLMAMGLSHEEAHGSIRFSLSRYTTRREIDVVVDAVKQVVENLRRLSPLYQESE